MLVGVQVLVVQRGGGCIICIIRWSQPGVSDTPVFILVGSLASGAMEADLQRRDLRKFGGFEDEHFNSMKEFYKRLVFWASLSSKTKKRFLFKIWKDSKEWKNNASMGGCDLSGRASEKEFQDQSRSMLSRKRFYTMAKKLFKESLNDLRQMFAEAGNFVTNLSGQSQCTLVLSLEKDFSCSGFDFDIFSQVRKTFVEHGHERVRDCESGFLFTWAWLNAWIRQLNLVWSLDEKENFIEKYGSPHGFFFRTNALTFDKFVEWFCLTFAALKSLRVQHQVPVPLLSSIVLSDRTQKNEQKIEIRPLKNLKKSSETFTPEAEIAEGSEETGKMDSRTWTQVGFGIYCIGPDLNRDGHGELSGSWDGRLSPENGRFLGDHRPFGPTRPLANACSAMDLASNSSGSSDSLEEIWLKEDVSVFDFVNSWSDSVGEFDNKSGSQSSVQESNEGMILTQFDEVGGGSPSESVFANLQSDLIDEGVSATWSFEYDAIVIQDSGPQLSQFMPNIIETSRVFVPNFEYRILSHGEAVLRGFKRLRIVFGSSNFLNLQLPVASDLSTISELFSGKFCFFYEGRYVARNFGVEDCQIFLAKNEAEVPCTSLDLLWACCVCDRIFVCEVEDTCCVTCRSKQGYGVSAIWKLQMPDQGCQEPRMSESGFDGHDFAVDANSMHNKDWVERVTYSGSSLCNFQVHFSLL